MWIQTAARFRTVSLCTHPDRLRGKLGRSPTVFEESKGQILFNRHSTAKEALTKLLDNKTLRREARISKRKKNLQKDLKAKKLSEEEYEQALEALDEEVQNA